MLSSSHASSKLIRMEKKTRQPQEIVIVSGNAKTLILKTKAL